jgi:isopenicillin N synthase-like dioxygenase
MVPDTSVPKSSENGDKVANLSVVSYQKLLSKDFAEAQILLHSCTEQGFFYLDLGSVDMKGYLKLKDSLFDVAKEYFSRSLEEKLQDSRDEIGVFNICGYTSPCRYVESGYK